MDNLPGMDPGAYAVGGLERVATRERQPVPSPSSQSDLRDRFVSRLHARAYAAAVTRLISARTGNFCSQALLSCADSHSNAHRRRSITESRYV